MTVGGGIRHPMFSVGEGVGRERQERIVRQGLLKKKRKKELLEVAPKQLPQQTINKIWTPDKLFSKSFEDLTVDKISKKDIKDKI